MIDRSHIAEGERRRDEGMNRAAARRPDRVTLGRLAMLRALLDSPSGTASLDDATPPDELASHYADGGKWRGQVIRSLIADDFAEHIGYVKTIRPAGHRRPIALLRLIDRQAAVLHLSSMTAAIAVYEATPTAGTVEAANSDTSQSTGNGESSNESI
ncbi:hypothetical protein EC9_02600 [Rosistilla ulvae]|uniref:Uncharacterized protein n=1 Tax=Rosistilla ulvae TaxID=1930277 RepID=A0A517LTZ9_9BACT|nr:(2,3-dihydroxybenzoyl)adenylate synthase [Rosistilla ulvae]QDS86102.1 hypothetical protein EC9_02600 [Rosistilla ulvae]